MKKQNGNMDLDALIDAANDDDAALLPAALKKRIAAGSKAESIEITIPTPHFQDLILDIVGDTPLISHAWSQKVLGELGKKKTKKDTDKDTRPDRNPQEEYEGSMYRTADGQPGIPARAIKQAMITAGSLMGVPPRKTKAAITVHGDILPITASDPIMRTDTVNVGLFPKRVAMLRYRAEYKEWRCAVRIRLWSDLMDVSQMTNLLNVAGFAVGLCEWRKEKGGGGNFGSFHAAPHEDRTTPKTVRRKRGA